MNYRKKLSARTQSQQEQQTQAHEQTQAAAREFHTVEELLRHDALRTPVPPGIASRLQESLAQSGPAPRPWWRRWLRGSNS
jgi:DNA-binding protein H-NS